MILIDTSSWIHLLSPDGGSEVRRREEDALRSGDAWKADAVKQLRRYQEADSGWKNPGAPKLFETVQILVASCGERAVHGTAGTSKRFFLAWEQPYPLTIVWRLRRTESHGPPPAPRKFVSGESVLYLGRHYCLKVEPEPHASGEARLLGEWLHVPASEGAQQSAQVRSALTDWLRRHAERRLSERVAARRATALIPRLGSRVSALRVC